MHWLEARPRVLRRQWRIDEPPRSFEDAQRDYGGKVEPIFASPRAGDVRDSLADISLARQILGYEPSVDLRTGLRPTVEYYRTHT
jgi:nucleoside-diphosphate-sugar epimerase